MNRYTFSIPGSSAAACVVCIMYIRKDQIFVRLHINISVHSTSLIPLTKSHTEYCLKKTRYSAHPVVAKLRKNEMVAGHGAVNRGCPMYSISLCTCGPRHTLLLDLIYTGHFGTRHRVQFPKMVHYLSRGDSGCLENDKEGCELSGVELPNPMEGF